MISRTCRLLLVVLIAVAGISCSSESDRYTTGQGMTGTEKMVKALAATEKTTSPQANIYFNDRRVRYMEKQALPQELGARMKYQFKLAHEYLRAGETKEAIRRFRDLYALVTSDSLKVVESFVYDVHVHLALSHLRWGEQQNCLINHTSASCIFPIKGEGIHKLKEGSRNAIEVYEDILEKHPDDLDSRWLLNIAYMTLGRYPHDVPEKWLIPPEAYRSDGEMQRFPDVASQVGLADDRTLAGGAIMEDFDRDGDQDIFTTSWNFSGPARFYENMGNGQFKLRIASAGLDGLVGGIHATQGDYNNDGYPDVFITRGPWLAEAGTVPNSLLRNNGDGTFTDVTEQAGLLSFHPTQTAAWGDYNNDGHLDLAVGNEYSGNFPTDSWLESFLVTAGGEDKRHPFQLYRNNGDGTFTEVAADVGIEVYAYIKGVAWGDYDNDGRSDLYISRLDGPNYLFHNDGLGEDRGWKFTDVSEKAGVQEPERSFPTWFWDYNNDGWLDIYVAGYRAHASDIASEYLGIPHDAALPRLYLNQRDGTFEDVTEEVNLDKIMYAMGGNYGDLDNDGYPDFYVGTGDPNFRSLIPNRMFRNERGQTFEEVTTSGGFGHLQKGHGVAFGDVDSDGDQDVFSVIGGSLTGDPYLNSLFLNPGHDNHWITLRLEGTTSNRSAIGTRIQVTIPEGDSTRTIHTRVTPGSSFGANTLQQEIGLGSAEKVESLTVRWPASNTTQTFEDVETDRFYRLKEGAEELQPIAPPTIDMASSDRQGLGESGWWARIARFVGLGD